VTVEHDGQTWEVLQTHTQIKGLSIRLEGYNCVAKPRQARYAMFLDWPGPGRLDD
jgi:hypothetical protein